MTSLPLVLPKGFSAKVRIDEKVSVGDILAESKTDNQLSVNIAFKLGVKNKKIGKLLRKKPGDAVSVGDVIAQKKSFFKTKTAVSKIAGTVTKFEEGSGNLFFARSSVLSQTIICPVDGIVEEVTDTKIVIKADKEAIVGTASSGETAEGEVLTFGKEKILESDISDVVKGRVIAGQNFDRDGLSKAIGVGTLGIISWEIEDSLIEGLAVKKIAVPVIKVSHTDFEKIKNGEKVLMEGSKKSIVKI